MPSVWVSQKDYEALMGVKTGLEKARKEPVGISNAISYLLEIISISTIPPERSDEIVQKLEKLRSIVKERMERGTKRQPP